MPGLGADDGQLLSGAVHVVDNTATSNDHQLRNLGGLFACSGSESISDGLDLAALLTE